MNAMCKCGGKIGVYMTYPNGTSKVGILVRCSCNKNKNNKNPLKKNGRSSSNDSSPFNNKKKR